MAEKKGLQKGAKLAPLKERLKHLGLVHDWDYVLHLPMRYEDETAITPLSEAPIGEKVQIEVTIEDSQVRFGRSPQLVATATDASGSEITIRFLHYYPSTRATFTAGAKLRLYGTLRTDYHGRLEMVHPSVKRATKDLPKTLTPIYPAGESITQPWLRKRIARALQDVAITDPIPSEWLNDWKLPTLAYALKRLHRPEPGANLEALENRTAPEWRRLKFDEFLAQQISLRFDREKKKELQSDAIHVKEAGLAEALLSHLPYVLTQAQKRVVMEIQRDLSRSRPMNRLLQGDVGSGKTIVATLAALYAIDSGFQVAFMAPTEILAEQHFRKVTKLLSALKVRIAWLSGSLKSKEKAAVREAIAAGNYDLVIGTHALISEGVTFKNLALAIIDEQHRFGVEQRLRLRSAEEKAHEKTPHLLMLSATPIPRTLAMSYLSDIDVSVIDELPPGRTPIKTKLVNLSHLTDVASVVNQEALRHTQTYWVCPLIEKSEALDLSAAVMRYEWLKDQYPNLKIGLLHSALSSEEKQSVMQSFEAGALDVLVATTVIEVGVDVAKANLMVIEHAERFGLAQLHQLRGRVGRGTDAGYCILLFSPDLSVTAKARLRAIRNTTDGFAIAQEDLRLRGPGEFLGVRQSGAPLLKYADPTEDLDLLEKARDAASWLIEHHPDLAREHARHWYESREGYLEA